MLPLVLAAALSPLVPIPTSRKRKLGLLFTTPKAGTSTLRPWKNGSNMDVNELQVGSILYLPVFQKGGLIWTGDSHCLQGNGEVNLTAHCMIPKSIFTKKP